MKKVFLALVALALASLACNAVASPGGDGPSVPQNPVQQIEYQDDFSDPNSGWPVAADADKAASYSGDGQYLLQALTARQDVWAHPGQTFSDTRIEVDATKSSGPEDNSFGIVCRFSCPGPVLVYDSSAAIHLYRIAQEAVNNAMKHGKASEIAISLRRDDGGIVLDIQNDGLQFRRPPADRRGLGISIMKYRATMIGATFDIRGAGNGGAVVTCSLPDGPDPDQCRQGGE